ncbi:hypothetical protein ACFQ9X_30095 [Catenulispora yoronensis]
MSIALPHRWTEDRFAGGPFTTTILRNGLYTEVPIGLAAVGLAGAASTGVFTASFGLGRISVVTKQDLADAAVRVAAESARDLAAGQANRHADRVYELEGDTAIGGADIAEALAEVLGRPVAYHPASLSETRSALGGAGIEPYQLGHAISLSAAIIAGRAEATGSDLPRLLDKAPRPVRPAIAEAVSGLLAQLVPGATDSEPKTTV